MSETPSAVYAAALMPKGYGFPLWIPEPSANAPEDYVKNGVRIGDVGVRSPRGSLDFLFNITLPANHEVNKRGFPDQFEGIEVQDDRKESLETAFGKWRPIACTTVKNIAGGGTLSGKDPYVYPLNLLGSFRFTHRRCRSGVISADGSLSFEFSTEKGGMLVLPNGASSEHLWDTGDFQAVASQYGVNWFRFAKKLGRGSATSLYLVTGCYKTRSWGVASVSKRSVAGSASLKLVTNFGGGSLTGSYYWKHESPADTRSGHSSKENHCVFVSGFTITLRRKPFGYFSTQKFEVEVLGIGGDKLLSKGASGSEGPAAIRSGGPGSDGGASGNQGDGSGSGPPSGSGNSGSDGKGSGDGSPSINSGGMSDIGGPMDARETSEYSGVGDTLDVHNDLNTEVVVEALADTPSVSHPESTMRLL
jgi:hypothetical protein